MDKRLSLFPQRRVFPYDGLVVTSQVWKDAHGYHHQAAQGHTLLFHGSGIVTGLEVVAGGQPEPTVYVQPGVAVDGHGRVIVVPETQCYELSSGMNGLLHLVISYRESQEGNLENSADDSLPGQPKYMREQFLVTASSIPESEDVVELARFHCSSLKKLRDAPDPNQPHENEIDLRYRQVVRAHLELPVTAGVMYLGEVEKKVQGRGLIRMGREVGHYCDYHLIVDDHLPSDHCPLDFSFLYLVGGGSLKFSASQEGLLHEHVDHGGTLIFDALGPAARDDIRELAQRLKIKLAPPEMDDPLLNEPFCFNEPPATHRQGCTVLVGDGMILSDAGYGAVWAGQAAASRADLRACMEWGANLLSAVVERRSRYNGQKMGWLR